MSAATAGIVLVSHSAKLAAGTAHLAAQVSGGTVTIIAAGGTDDGDLGTSDVKTVAAAAEEARHVRQLWAAGNNRAVSTATASSFLNTAGRLGG
jgi:dihydroxyacetone kinase DhaKLM complex PTS-EIIA-like component DhaM